MVASNSPSSKRKFITATLLSVLLVSALAGTMLLDSAIANFFWRAPDVPPPNPATIQISAPQNNTSYNGNQVTLRVSIVNLSDMYSISCHLDGEEIARRYVSDFIIYLTDLSEGTHTIRISVSNQKIINYQWLNPDYQPENNNIFSHLVDDRVYSDVVSSNSEVSFRVDNTAPRVSVLSPQEGTYDSKVVLNFEVDETTSKVTYSLDGRENVTTVGNMRLTGLTVGEHSVQVYAWDEAGNVGTSETISFTVAEPESAPFPTAPVAAASVASIAVVGVALLVYFKKRRK